MQVSGRFLSMYYTAWGLYGGSDALAGRDIKYVARVVFNGGCMGVVVGMGVKSIAPDTYLL